MSPRPILKQPSHHQHPNQQPLPQYPSSQHPPSRPQQHQRHAVHFPPSPSLTRTFSAYSSTAYDRSPIDVSPNSCALPERGCPGRTYHILDSSTSGLGKRGIEFARDYHPRALAFASSSNTNVPHYDYDHPLPTLVPDLSSSSESSEESDGFSPGGLDSSSSLTSSSFGGSMTPVPYPYMNAKQNMNQDAYSPNLYTNSNNASMNAYAASTSVRKFKRHDRSKDPDLIRNSPEEDDFGFAPASPTIYPLSASPTLAYASPPSPSSSLSSRKKLSTSPTRRKGVRNPSSSGYGFGGSGFGGMNDGCLGGF